MAMSKFFAAAALVVLAALVAGVLYFNPLSSSSPSGPVSNTGSSSPIKETPAPARTSLTGTWECLPHKNTSGPQTMECAFGIKTDDGLHYGIGTSLMSAYPVDYPTGSRVRVDGIITPVEALSSIQKYDIAGVINATSIQKI